MASYVPVSLAYKCVEPKGGVTDKVPVIFLHGLSASKDYWFDIPDIVAEKTGRKVYALDARNHGDSPWSDTCNFDINVDDLFHFMDTNNIPKAIIVGHSMGGLTGLRIALKSPERVDKLVIEDISISKVSKEVIDTIRHRLALAKAAIQKLPAGLDLQNARKFIVEFIYNAMPPEAQKFMKFDDRYYMLPLKKTEDGRYAYKANIDGLAAALNVPLPSADEGSEHSGLYEGPTCFIYGKASPFLVSSDEEKIKKHFPNAELVGIDNATHTVHCDCTKEFTEALISFLLKN